MSMSSSGQADIYQGSLQIVDRKPDHRFVLALICMALALVLVSVMFPDAFRPSGEFSLFGP
jgi:hypothetical protein